MSLARGKPGWPGWPGWRWSLVLGTGTVLGFLLASTFKQDATSAPDAGSSLRGPGLARAAAAASALPPLPAQDARELAEVLQRVRAGYVDAVDEHVLMQQAARGMVASLDSHSALLDAADYAQLRAATDGSYAGIGVEVDGNAGALRVVRCLPASPAMRAGLRAGDQIVRIDGREVGAANIDAAAAQLRGAPGSTVRLAVRRGASASTLLDVQLTRSQVELASTAAEMLAPGFGYLRIREFTSATPGEVDAAVAQLRSRAGGRLRGLVIDLRDNPGGVLEAAGAVADDFLDHGTIVSADGRLRDARFRMVATPGDLIDGAPIAVLVNGNSASAAEILAAALRQNNRALLLGARTYGKGTVQTVMPLSDGRALKLTTARYYTPAGDSINGIGIEPDRVLGSAQQSPASIDATGRAPTLARRDAPVAVALAELRGAARLTRTY